MHTGIFITGTDTGVGKTFISCGLIKAMRSMGMHVCPMKPVETGCTMKNGELIPGDTEKLMKASDISGPVDIINPFRFKKPLAPSVAAALEGKRIDRRTILRTYKKLSETYETVIVEGAGGIMVPIHKQYYVLDLIHDLDLPVIIVSRPGLGTINHSLLTVEAARSRGVKILGIIFNNASNTRRDLSFKTNPEVIHTSGKIPVIGTVPFMEHTHKEKSEKMFDKITDAVLQQVHKLNT